MTGKFKTLIVSDIRRNMMHYEVYNEEEEVFCLSVKDSEDEVQCTFFSPPKGKDRWNISYSDLLELLTDAKQRLFSCESS